MSKREIARLEAEVQRLDRLQEQFDARQVKLDAIWAKVEQNNAACLTSKWRLIRNARLIRESKALMAQSDRLLREFPMPAITHGGAG